MEWKKLRQAIQKGKVNSKSNNGVWGDLFSAHILQKVDPTDDMLFYVKTKTPQLTDIDTVLDVFRVESEQRPPLDSRRYSWEETFYLNLLLHQFTYVMTCAVCEQKKPGKDLKVYRSFSLPVFGSPNKHTMSGKAKHTTISYPNIYFSVFNFDEIFDGIVLTDNEMVCVELVAIDRSETVQISVFLGSVRYEILHNTLETRASLKNKILKQVSMGLYGGDPNSQFITMNGPKCRGRVEMCVSIFRPDTNNKSFVVSFDREADVLDTESTGNHGNHGNTSAASSAKKGASSHSEGEHQPDNRRLSENTKQRYISNSWKMFTPSVRHQYVNAQLTYLTLRWDELLDDLLDAKKRPLLYHNDKHKPAS